MGCVWLRSLICAADMLSWEARADISTEEPEALGRGTRENPLRVVFAIDEPRALRLILRLGSNCAAAALSVVVAIRSTLELCSSALRDASYWGRVPRRSCNFV